MTTVVCPYLSIRGAARAIDFYQKIFGATETYRLTDPAGKIGHAEIQIGESRIMLSDESPDFGALSPETVGGCPVRFHILVEDVDDTVRRAIDAGAILLRPVADQFYGERTGMITDPFGYSWFVATTTGSVSPDQMQQEWNKAFEDK